MKKLLILALIATACCLNPRLDARISELDKEIQSLRIEIPELVIAGEYELALEKAEQIRELKDEYNALMRLY